MKRSRVDALIVGAGFGGIYQLYSLRNLGISVRVIDKAAGVGGTWYWNRYPGAMSDTESYVYRYSWDNEDLKTYPWPNRYLRQDEILAYLEHIVRKHDLRKDIQLSTELLSARWDEECEVWVLSCSGDETIETRYLITALGLLSTPNYPDIPGLRTFRGRLCHTSAWDPSIRTVDQHVGIIGCGSTGVQRHPQYSVPNGNRIVDPSYRQWFNENCDEIFTKLRKSKTCFGVPESTTPYASVLPSKREEVFRKLWDEGNGFNFMYGGFSDIATNKEANEAACEFIRSQIASIVKDPEKARKLSPRDSYSRRPLCDNGYYQQFNRENVDIVHLQETPIHAVTPTGVTTTDGTHYKLDVLVVATGFDAVEGSYNQVRIEGKSGKLLKDRWSNGPTSYMGCFVSDFPNMFMITGPQAPFTNLPPAIEVHVEFITKLISKAEKYRQQVGRGATIEASPQAEAEWVAQCNSLADGSLFRETPSWLFCNAPAAPKPIPRFYLGGMARYVELVEEVLRTHGGLQPLGKSHSKALLA